MKISKQSRNSALAAPTIAAISVLTSVLMTIGRTPSCRRGLVDARDDLVRLFDRVDERQRDFLEAHARRTG